MSIERISPTRPRVVRSVGISTDAAILSVVFAALLFVTQALQGQAIHGEPGSSSALELPVILRHGVESGRTPVGAKIQAKLTVATLVEGVVVPEGAKLYGEVTESANSGSGSRPASGSRSTSSRLGIRMDSAEWKIGSKPATISFASKVYLSAWYYPLVSPLDHNPADAPPTILRNPQQRRSGTTGYPSTPRSTPPFPTSTTDSDPDPVPTAPKSIASQHRELMEDVELIHNPDGSVVLTSTQPKIKLDTSTTYVLSSVDLMPAK